MFIKRAIIAFAALAVALAATVLIGILVRDTHLERRVMPGRLSVELRDAPYAGSREARVGRWLQLNKNDIVSAESRFHIDRRAIAGLIAYEALVNVHLSRYGGIARWSGPGKVHFKEYFFEEGEPLSADVEKLGLLPSRSVTERAALLRRADWAALYIAASMRVLADVVAARTRYDVTCKPGALVTLGSAWGLDDARRHFQRLDPHGRLFTYNFAGNWVQARLPFLEAAVGRPSRALCRTGPTSNARRVDLRAVHDEHRIASDDRRRRRERLSVGRTAQ